MTENFIADAHMHVGSPGVFFTPGYDAADYIALMDQNHIAYAVCCDMLTLMEDISAVLETAAWIYGQSHQRIFSFCVFHPDLVEQSLQVIRQAAAQPYVAGIKIHPSFHGVEADSEQYEAIWDLAAQHDLAIMSHTWSVSAHNPVQKLSTPLKFEKYVKRFPEVRFVLGHFGGRGTGRDEAIQLIREYPQVYGDFAGVIFDYELIENLVRQVPAERILFGSDYSWFDPKANILRVILADIDEDDKLKILRDNAVNVYKLDV